MKIKDNKSNDHKSGDWLMICDRCGVTVHRSLVKRQSDGFYMCTKTVNDCWEESDVFDNPRKLVRSSLPIMGAAPADNPNFTSHSTYASDGTEVPDPSQL